MKTRWTFQFTSKGVQIPAKRSFRVRAAFANEPEVVCRVDVIPAKNDKPPDADDGGELLVTVPGPPEDNEQLAFQIADRLAQQISFPYGRIEIQHGLITATRIPETAEEETEIGDTPHLVKLAFEEVPRFMPSFDPAQLTQARSDPEAMELLKQFNTAKEVHSDVERFLAFFKVLEKAYASGPERKLLSALRRNRAFIDLVTAVVVDRRGRGEKALDSSRLDDFLRKVVRLRDNCAHLRKKTGYAPGDPRIAAEVRPLLAIIEVLARECVNRHVYPGGGPEPQRPWDQSPTRRSL